MRPLCTLLKAYVDNSGEVSRAHRLLEVLEATTADARQPATGGTLQSYVGLVHEQRFMEQLKQEVTSTSWMWMPRSAWTLAHQNLGFRLASRAGCLVEELLIRPTRSFPLSRSASEGRSPSQGRPLGLLAAWLAHGAMCGRKEDHWNKDQWPSLEERSAHRELLALVPGSDTLFAAERPQRPGEGPEPDQRD